MLTRRVVVWRRQYRYAESGIDGFDTDTVTVVVERTVQVTLYWYIQELISHK